MKKAFYFSIFTFCLCSLFIIAVNAQNRNSITGFVFGESRTPLSNIYVELLDDNYATLSRMRTNGSGLYSFRGLSNGRFSVRVLTIGTDYEEQTNSVSLIPVSIVAGGGSISEQLDFYMKPRKKRGNENLGAPGVIFVQEIPAEAKKMYESGASDLAEKKEDTGLTKIKQAIEIFPDYYLALERLGNEYLTRGYYQPASSLFIKAVSVNPKSFTCSFGLGLAAFRLNQPDDAVKYFRESIEKSNTSVNAHMWLGIVLHSKSNLTEALESLLKANKLSEGSAPEVHFQLARVYKDQNKFQKAADELELYLKYAPESKNISETKQIINTLRKKK